MRIPSEAGIGQNVVLKGTGLSRGQLYGFFEIDPQQSVQNLSSNTGPGTQQTALPEYKAHQPVTGQVRLKRTIPFCGDLFSNPLPFDYRPSDPFVTEAHFLMDLSVGMIFISPGYSISFNGFSFGNPPGNVWLTPAQFSIGGKYKDDTSSFSPDGHSLIVQHRYGQSDYDDFFAGCSLRNGYMVGQMLLTPSCPPGAFVIPTVQPKNNSLIHTKIFWHSGYYQINLNYQMSFVVTGPVGFTPW